jgi:hypothetical protein
MLAATDDYRPREDEDHHGADRRREIRRDALDADLREDRGRGGSGRREESVGKPGQDHLPVGAERIKTDGAYTTDPITAFHGQRAGCEQSDTF